MLVNISRFPKHGDNNALLGVCSRLSWGFLGFLKGSGRCSGFFGRCSGVFRVFQTVPGVPGCSGVFRCSVFRCSGVAVFLCSWNYYMPLPLTMAMVNDSVLKFKITWTASMSNVRM